MIPAIQEGLEHFNAGRFFEAHESWEAVWLDSGGEERRFLHGLIQVAAAFHHYKRNNLAGFQSLLLKGSLKLRESGINHFDLDATRLLQDMEVWQPFVSRPLPALGLPMPKIYVARPEE